MFKSLIRTVTIILFIRTVCFGQDIPVSSVNTFNEKGFPSNNNTGFNANEIVNDYSGNLMLSFGQRAELFNGDFTEFSLFYNSNVEHRVFIDNHSLNYNNAFYCNSPEWIIGYAGIALQTFNFETHYKSNNANGEPRYNRLENSEVGMLIPGYHYSNKLDYDLTIENGRPFHGIDFINILKSDGSKITLYNSTDGLRVGNYYEEGSDAKGIAIVSYIPNTDNKLRKVYYCPGDGNRYYFEEEWSQLYGAESAINDPKVLYLKEIYSTLNDTIKFVYSNELNYLTDLINGRKAFKYAISNKQFEYDGKRKPVEINYVTYNELDIDKLKRIELNSAAGNKLYVNFDLASQVDLNNLDRDAVISRSLKVTSIEDDIQRSTIFTSGLHYRDFVVHGNDISIRIFSNLISNINYPTGKSTSFEYYDKVFSSNFNYSPIKVIIISINDLQSNEDNMEAAFRDCYTNYMIKKVENRLNNSFLSSSEYTYIFDKPSGLTIQELMREAAEISQIKTSKKTSQYSDNSAPQDVIESKIYSQYKTSWFSVINSDFTSTIKLKEEHLSTTDSPTINTLSIIYDYEIGDLQNIGPGMVFYNGDFHQKSVTEKRNLNNEIKERLISSTIYLETENLYTGTSQNIKKTPKVIQTLDANELKKIEKFKNYIPTIFNTDQFYKLGMLEEVIIKKDQTVKENVKNIYYEEGENTSENPNGIMVGRLKQTIENYNIRPKSQTYVYYTPNQSNLYRGYLKSVSHSNGIEQHYTYPDKDWFGDDYQAWVFDSVSANKINYDGTKRYEWFKKAGQQFKPFKTVIKYNNSNDSLLFYTSYDRKDNLNFEVDINSNYSEFYYDKIGRLTKTIFPGSFCTYDSLYTHTYQSIVKDTLVFGREIGSCRTVTDEGESYTNLMIVKDPEMNATDGGVGWIMEEDSESQKEGEGDELVDTTHTKIPRVCYVFFGTPLNTSLIDSLLSVELLLTTGGDYLPDPSESRTIYVKGVRSDSVLFGSSISFTYQHPQTYSSLEINIKPIIEQYRQYGYTLIGLQFDSPKLFNNYEYNYKEFRFQYTGSNGNPPYIAIRYLKTFTDTLRPEGSFLAFYRDYNNSVKTIKRFTNSPTKLLIADEDIHYYNGDGQLSINTQVSSSGEFQKEKIEYNYLNKAKSVEDGEHRKMYTRFDHFSRPIQQKTDQNWDTGNSKRIEYLLSTEADIFNIEKITDENNKISKKYYDKIGNLKKEERTDGTNTLTTNYNYDNLYRLTSVVSPSGKVTSYVYDEHSNIKQKTSPDEGTHNYKYDKYGNMRFQFHNSNLQWVTFNKYDQFKRLVLTGLKTLADDPNQLEADLDYSVNQGSFSHFENTNTDTANFVVVNMYDKYNKTGVFLNMPNPHLESFIKSKNLKGKLVATAFRDKPGQSWSYKVYTYDYLGRVDYYWVKMANKNWKVVINEYDNLGNVIKQSVNNEFFVWNDYDEQGRLKEVRSNIHNAYTTAKLDAVYTYDKSDKITSVEYGSRVKPIMNYTYDTKGRLIDLDGIATDMFNTQFKETITYYDNDNIHTQFIKNNANENWANLNFTYTYDAYNRLIGAACNNSSYTENYTYDNDGNFNTKNRSGLGMVYNYLPNTNKLNYVKINNVNKYYVQDYRGNVTSDQYRGTSNITYDRRNLPLSFVKNSQTNNYRYDDAGQRIYKGVYNQTKEYYFRDHTGKELGVYDLNTGRLKMLNLYGNGLMGKVNVGWDSTLVNDPEVGTYWSYTRRDERNFYFKDHLGSIRMILDEASEIVGAQDYYPYGSILRSYTTGGNVNDKYKFTEKERDVESGYDYFGARYYDGDLGRWLQVDPLADKYPGWSPYNYCLNNPLIYFDPNGMEWYYYQADGEDDKNWHYHNTKEKNIWTGDYDKDGNKVMEMQQGIVELLTFNGYELSWLQADGGKRSWTARSGELDENGNTQPNLQLTRDRGPIPEGTYQVDPKNTLSILNPSNVIDFIVWIIKSPSWGSYNTPILSLDGSKNYANNRNSAYIHGGFYYGSAGCIDLANNDSNFFSYLQSHNKRMILKVNYNEK